MITQYSSYISIKIILMFFIVFFYIFYLHNEPPLPQGSLCEMSYSNMNLLPHNFFIYLFYILIFTFLNTWMYEVTEGQR